MNTPAYQIENLGFTASTDFYLHIPAMQINNGDIIGLAGANGSGKSTLMRILAFLDTPNNGTILYHGNPEISLTQKREITMLPQSPYLLKQSVFNNVIFGLRVRQIKSMDKRKLQDLAAEALHEVGLLYSQYSHRRGHELSGGEAQRIALASRLIFKPRVLILDEPIASVDTESGQIITQTILRLKEKKQTTIIVSSHDYYWLNNICENIFKMQQGKIIGHGRDNIFYGPWQHAVDDLWQHTLFNGEKIFATQPPYSNAYALLSPTDIILSNQKPKQISAQNILRGKIQNMSAISQHDSLFVIVEISDLKLHCTITRHAAETMALLPGKEIFLIFKASSLRWQNQ